MIDAQEQLDTLIARLAEVGVVMEWEVENGNPKDYKLVNKAAEAARLDAEDKASIARIAVANFEAAQETLDALEPMARELLDCNCISMLPWSGTEDRDSKPTVKTLCRLVGVKTPRQYDILRMKEYEEGKR